MLLRGLTTHFSEAFRHAAMRPEDRCKSEAVGWRPTLYAQTKIQKKEKCEEEALRHSSQRPSDMLQWGLKTDASRKQLDGVQLSTHKPKYKKKKNAKVWQRCIGDKHTRAKIDTKRHSDCETYSLTCLLYACSLPLWQVCMLTIYIYIFVSI